MEKTDQKPLQKEKRTRSAGRIAGMAAGIAVGVLAAAYLAVCIAAAAGKTTLRRTQVLGVDVGGLTAQEVRDKWQRDGADACSGEVIHLTLGEETPGLSGGEAQRIKLSAEMGRAQSDTVFVFDEPTIGLHPLDVKTLLCVFRTLLAAGATVVVIEHDLDVIRTADWIVDMGPGGGDSGGYIVAEGTLDDIKTNPRSVTGRYI